MSVAFTGRKWFVPRSEILGATADRVWCVAGPGLSNRAPDQNRLLCRKVFPTTNLAMTHTRKIRLFLFPNTFSVRGVLADTCPPQRPHKVDCTITAIVRLS